MPTQNSVTANAPLTRPVRLAPPYRFTNADTSLAFDREEKIPLYAAAGIPEVWLVDLVDKSLTVYRQPDRGTYAQVTRLRSGAMVPIPTQQEVFLPVSELGF